MLPSIHSYVKYAYFVILHSTLVSLDSASVIGKVFQFYKV